VSESEVMRHYVSLSTKNHHIDKGFYPLGSCTMKYNPKVNDVVAALPGFATLHPFAPPCAATGMLELMARLQEQLCEVSGFDAVSLQPVAGAHGEFCGLLMMRAYHLENKQPERKKIIIPDSAHGTNPASVAAVGYTTVQVGSNSEGVIDPDAVAALMDETVAGIMMTNPNTLGLFERNVRQISDIVHNGGGLVYMDGANLNAHMGIFRPGDIGFDIMHFNLHKTFSTPHGGGGPGAGAVGVTSALAKYLPTPTLGRDSDGKPYFEENRPASIGRLHSFYGNVANMIRAYAYISSLGGDGLKAVSENAVLNANYLKVNLIDDYDLPYTGNCMHEFVLSGNRQKKLGVRTLDISKRLLDFGVHSPTNYFPLIVPEAMMIEPTETESRETLDQFVAIMKKIAREVETDPELVKTAPHDTPVRRLDEATAARTLDINYAG
ncbi:MAG: aminomethyl-transferring glycine dehydrogenase subunit GcvPB, partial [candidate division Zixibacteria bacterium]